MDDFYSEELMSDHEGQGMTAAEWMAHIARAAAAEYQVPVEDVAWLLFYQYDRWHEHDATVLIP
jgi:hypothetical protein